MLRLMCLLKGSVYCLNSHLDRANTMIDQSLITCPHCGTAKLERMPTGGDHADEVLDTHRNLKMSKRRSSSPVLIPRPAFSFFFFGRGGPPVLLGFLGFFFRSMYT